MIDSLKGSGLGVGPAYRVPGWSESAYYARKKRPKSARRLRDEQLMPLIQQVHAEYRAAPVAPGGSPAHCDARALSSPAAPSSG